MVEVLDDHLAELETEVFVHRVLDVIADEGNLLPYQDAATVGLLEHEVSLWIVGQTKGVDAHFAHQVIIGQVMLPGQCSRHILPLLMAADATQTDVLAIEEEALVGINPKVAEACLFLDAVDLLAVAAQGGDEGVEIGVGGTIPEMRTIDGKVDDGLVVVDIRSGLADDGVAFGIEQRYGHFAALVAALREQMHFGHQVGTFLGDATLVEQYALGTKVERRDAGILVGHFEPDVAVEAAGHVVVTTLGSYVEAMGVVAGDGDDVVLAVVHAVGEFDGKGIVGALMFQHVGEIDVDVGHLGGTLKLEEDAFALPCLGHFEVLHVRTLAAEVAFVAHDVVLVEGVGQVDQCVALRDADVGIDAPRSEYAFLEAPFLVEGGNFAGL